MNVCIEISCFPKCWKNYNNPVEIKNLRPIGILPILSKIVERVLEWQINEYIHEKGILPEIQSGFRKNHNCKITLTKTTSDIITAVDRRQLTALFLIFCAKTFNSYSQLHRN